MENPFTVNYDRTKENRLIDDIVILQKLSSEFIKEYVGFRKYYNIRNDLDTMIGSLSKNRLDGSTLKELRNLVDKYKNEILNNKN